MDVSLKQGLARIRLKPGNTVTLAQVRKAIENNAFAPKEARVVVVGDLLSSNGKLQFKVSGTDEVFPVAPTSHAFWEKQPGRTLRVTGLISAPASRTDPGTLQITEASQQPGGAK